MRDVLIALLPAAAFGIYQNKVPAALIILVSVAGSVLSELIWELICHRTITISDLSAVVTGLILALILPVHVPLWIPALGSIFATLVVKQFFGGVGSNFMNPAIAAKVFLMTSWTAVLIKPAVDAVGGASAAEAVSAASGAAEAVSSASQAVVQSALTLDSVWKLFLNQSAQNIGEASVAALLLGGLYLLIRRVISYKIPLSFIASYALMTWFIGGKEGMFTGDVITGTLSGVLFMAALFMASDPASSPSHFGSQLLFGALCGSLAVVFKVYGYNGEGAYYAIIVMNLFVPLIDKLFSRRAFNASVKEAI